MSQPRLDFEALRKMVAGGCSAADLLAAVEASRNAAKEARREGNRLRQARLRHNRRNGVTGGVTALRARANEIKELDITALRNGVTNGSSPFPPSPPKEVSPHTPLQEITPSSLFSPSPMPRARARVRVLRRLPEDFSLSLEMARYAAERGFTGNACQALFDAFADHHRARGNAMLDWVAAWRTWVRNELKFNRPTMNGHRHDAPRPGSREDTRERTQAVLASLRASLAGADEPGAGLFDRGAPAAVLPGTQPGKP